MAQGKWSEVEARGVLEALKRSGLPLERFAKERGIVAQRLRWWKKKFSRQARAAAALANTPPVLPVRMAEAPRRGEPVTVRAADTGHMLKVSHGFDEDAFARVVALLEGA
jgi:hypothetical protein